jgi:hypothetical protein
LLCRKRIMLLLTVALVSVVVTSLSASPAFAQVSIPQVTIPKEGCSAISTGDQLSGGLVSSLFSQFSKQLPVLGSCSTSTR